MSDSDGTSGWRRYIPLVCWAVVLLTGLFISLKIIGYGYLPPGDARRHAAKPFAGKPYSEIITMRPEYVVDHSPGWEWLLGALHRTLGWSKDALISFSLISLLLSIFCLPLIWVRRPEAWLAALLAQMLAIPELMIRWVQARPYILCESLMMVFLLAWGREESKPSRWKIALTFIGFALAVWLRGTWYLWALLIIPFFLAQRWRDGLWLTACWLGGTVGGALLTSNPISFLYEALFQAYVMNHEHLPGRMLVGELRPSDGEFATVAVLALVYLWRKPHNKDAPPLFRQPVFWAAAFNWALCFKADRFWADWGMPAAVAWLATQFDDALPTVTAPRSVPRLLLCGLLAVPLFWDSTNDTGRRYTFNLEETLPTVENMRDWTPGKGGLVYADNMSFFFDAFYANPQADWRYVVGFEPALMLPEDLKVYREIQRSGRNPAAYEPWLKRMRPEDRLVVESPYQPDISSLEWFRDGKYWLGRLPRKEPGKH